MTLKKSAKISEKKRKKLVMVFMEFLTTESEKLIFIGKDIYTIFTTTNKGTSFEDKILIDFFPCTYSDVEKYELPDFLENLNKFSETKDCILLGTIKDFKIPTFSF